MAGITNVNYSTDAVTYGVRFAKETSASSHQSVTALGSADVSDRTPNFPSQEDRNPLKTDTEQQQLELTGATKVDGAILELDANTAYCEIYRADGNVNINLPLGLLPEERYPGMPISISLSIDNGISRFLIAPRELKQEDKAYSDPEVEAALATL